MSDDVKPLSGADLEAVKRNRCPRCQNFGFIAGPRGTEGQNVYCANPNCRASFMVAPRQAVVYAHATGTAPEHLYPPKVHFLNISGRALCGFSLADPGDWPVGHSWIERTEFETATCPACRKKWSS